MINKEYSHGERQEYTTEYRRKVWGKEERKGKQGESCMNKMYETACASQVGLPQPTISHKCIAKGLYSQQSGMAKPCLVQSTMQRVCPPKLYSNQPYSSQPCLPQLCLPRPCPPRPCPPRPCPPRPCPPRPCPPILCLPNECRCLDKSSAHVGSSGGTLLLGGMKGVIPLDEWFTKQGGNICHIDPVKLAGPHTYLIEWSGSVDPLDDPGYVELQLLLDDKPVGGSSNTIETTSDVKLAISGGAVIQVPLGYHTLELSYETGISGIEIEDMNMRIVEIC